MCPYFHFVFQFYLCTCTLLCVVRVGVFDLNLEPSDWMGVTRFMMELNQHGISL